ncbi:helix-turn-helix domain-containing protein [Sphingomonas montanisoli]|uniref:Helix-turn-helix domain-containing protein n=1 Tax=Sphingomonas montanisoli TaxID=2606412 RepID=A0A5D9C4L4_9SPHN|nr:helix-turn-helix domain-containing protein [Sphingomonas montanisoli]TZG24905.1 helix-turn-helix domain-containing protein [Sphingomonas montanisoli]
MGLALERLPDWPAALTTEEALAYTGVAETQLRAWAKARKVHFLPIGPNGAKLVLRDELDAALRARFAAVSDNDVIEF